MIGFLKKGDSDDTSAFLETLTDFQPGAFGAAAQKKGPWVQCLSSRGHMLFCPHWEQLKSDTGAQENKTLCGPNTGCHQP